MAHCLLHGIRVTSASERLISVGCSLSGREFDCRVVDPHQFFHRQRVEEGVGCLSSDGEDKVGWRSREPRARIVLLVHVADSINQLMACQCSFVMLHQLLQFSVAHEPIIRLLPYISAHSSWAPAPPPRPRLPRLPLQMSAPSCSDSAVLFCSGKHIRLTRSSDDSYCNRKHVCETRPTLRALNNHEPTPLHNRFLQNRPAIS